MGRGVPGDTSTGYSFHCESQLLNIYKSSFIIQRNTTPCNSPVAKAEHNSAKQGN